LELPEEEAVLAESADSYPSHQETLIAMGGVETGTEAPDNVEDS
jgi:hypothetical protein